MDTTLTNTVQHTPKATPIKLNHQKFSTLPLSYTDKNVTPFDVTPTHSPPPPLPHNLTLIIFFYKLLLNLYLANQSACQLLLPVGVHILNLTLLFHLPNLHFFPFLNLLITAVKKLLRGRRFYYFYSSLSPLPLSNSAFKHTNSYWIIS